MLMKIIVNVFFTIIGIMGLFIVVCSVLQPFLYKDYKKEKKL